jgi:steroid 5-alpha reductase family enzyme
MELISTLLLCLLASSIIATGVFLLAYINNKRYDLVDVGWGDLFFIAALTALVTSENLNYVGYVVILLVFIWGFRLSYHIAKRWIKTDKEDARYVELRKKWPQKFLPLQVYIRIYLVQAFLAVLICIPAILAISGGGEGWPVYLGIFVWTFGFIIESVADRQLKKFIANPQNKGKIMDKGLWGLSRHPNYFGEITMWLGIAIIALPSHLGWLGLIGPLLLAILILFVSGIPPAEKRMAKKPGWKKYKNSTRALVPLPKL